MEIYRLANDAATAAEQGRRPLCHTLAGTTGSLNANANRLSVPWNIEILPVPWAAILAGLQIVGHTG